MARSNPLRVHGDRKEAERLLPRSLPPASACEDYNSQRPLRLAPALWLLGRRYGGYNSRGCGGSSDSIAGLRLQGHPDLSYLRKTAPRAPALADLPSGMD